MEWLLKITEGPMKGAEVALVKGTRVSVGRDAACDIVISDASLAERAFEIDVSEEAVSLVLPDGSARAMKAFETHSFGTTTVAVGPLEGGWEALHPAQEATPTEAPEASEEPAPAEVPQPTATDATAEAPEEKTEDRRHKGGCGCLLVLFLLLLLLLVGLAAAAWVFRGDVKAKWPESVAYYERVEAMVGKVEPSKTVKAKASPMDLLRELAGQQGVALSVKDGVPTLTGNLARRTERLALRALALSADSRCRLDVSDDETLFGSANALLFTVTEGALKTSAAKDRKLTLAGYAPTAAAYERVLAALRADVPWFTKVDSAAVQIGGPVPPELRENPFATAGLLQSRARANQVALEPVVAVESGREAAAPHVAETDKTAADAKPAGDGELRIADSQGRGLPRNMFPVAGVLTRPYPCIVLHDGHRIVEGGQLGAYTVERISAAEIVLRRGEGRTRWNP